MARYALALLLLLPMTANAHEVDKPRLLVITPRANALEIRVNEMWPAGEESNAFRRSLDADRDGRLSYEEQERLRNAAVEAATQRLRVLDENGAPLDLKRATARVQGAQHVEAAVEVSIDVGLRVALEPDAKGRYDVTVVDYRSDEHTVEAVVTLPAEVELVRASLGDHHEERRRVTGVELTKEKPLRLLWRESR